MKKIIYATLMVAVSIIVFGQQAKPLKFGFELDGKLKKVDPNTPFDSPTGVAYVGMFTEFYVVNHFSGKLKVGLNNTYYHRPGGSSLEITGEIVDYPERSMYKQTLGISLEPRFYFFSTKKLRKTNFYISLPVAFERYSVNRRLLAEGMKRLGYKALLPEEVQSPIISSFEYPSGDFSFHDFYNGLKKSGFVIYPGKISERDTFRIGTIGQVYPDDIRDLIKAMQTCNTH